MGIHSDHGLDYVKDKEEPEQRYPHANALLLIKPIGITSAGAFSISHCESSLLDVAPTILDAIGIHPPSDYGGLPLLNAKTTCLDRKKYFYNIERENPDSALSKAVLMRRYNVKKGILSFEESIKDIK